MAPNPWSQDLLKDYQQLIKGTHRETVCNRIDGLRFLALDTCNHLHFQELARTLMTLIKYFSAAYCALRRTWQAVKMTAVCA